MPIPYDVPTAEINATEAGTVEILAGVADQQILIYSYFFVVGSAVNLFLSHGEGEDDTPYSPALPFPSAGSVSIDPLGDQPRYVLPAGESFRLTQDGSAVIAGTVWYGRIGVVTPE